MALGGSHMSSTVTPTSTQSALPPPVQITSGGGDGLQQKGANYFFGFLITFVVLLLVFVGCGIGSRRRFIARRQAGFLGNTDPWASLRPDGAEQPRPELHERFFKEPVGEENWKYTMPLSVTMLRRVNDSPPDDPPPGAHEDSDAPTSNSNLELEHPTSSTPAIMPTDNPSPQAPPPPPPPLLRRATEVEHVFPSFPIPSWIPRPENKRRSSSDEKEGLSGAAVDPPEALEVAVMIAMPSSSNPASLHHHSHLPHPHPNPNPHLLEYQIGVATLPWHTEVNWTSTLPSTS